MQNVSRCVVKVVDVISPYMGEWKGRKLVAAHPNNAGRNFGRPCTSFRKPYLVYEAAVTGLADVERAKAELARQGYEVVEEG